MIENCPTNYYAALALPGRLVAPELDAPILSNFNLEALRRLEGELTIISHPAYWRSANQAVSSLVLKIYRQHKEPEEAERRIKQGMMEICYGKGFLHEAKFEATLLKSQKTLAPVIITMDFESQNGNTLLLSNKHRQCLTRYLNWCIKKYSAGNIFILPTRHKNGRLLDKATIATTMQACKGRSKIVLHGGIIDCCLLQTATDLCKDAEIASNTVLNDNYCYASTGAHIPARNLNANTYFNQGVEAWGRLGGYDADQYKCNATMAFKRSLPQVTIVY